jgi:TorA maturation chaperone TorD
MGNCTRMNEPAQKIRTKKREIPDAGSEDAGLEKGAILEQQDAEARGNVYGFLSAVYLHPPEQILLQRIVAKGFLDELSALFGGEAVAGLKKFAAATCVKKDAGFIKQDYMDLFAVPKGRYVTPFEDVYRGISAEGERQKGPLVGTQTISVRKIYRVAGAEMGLACKELPTHIGVELAFMGFLCEREAAAIFNEKQDKLEDQRTMKTAEPIRYRELQIRFLQDHLNEWFPQLSKSIQANANSYFYRGMAQLTEAFLSRDSRSTACWGSPVR